MLRALSKASLPAQAQEHDATNRRARLQPGLADPQARALLVTAEKDAATRENTMSQHSRRGPTAKPGIRRPREPPPIPKQRWQCPTA